MKLKISQLNNEEKEYYFMNLALKEAMKAYKIGEVPIGCVITYKDEVISKAYNKRTTHELTHAHAEMLAIIKANRKLGSWRLEDCNLYVTLEPCSMCAGAMIQARIKELYFGAYDPKAGAVGSKLNLMDIKFNHTISVKGGILESASSELIKDFFKNLRETKA